MIFTLEVLQARKGDALLLHYGDLTRPRLAMIDGGPSGVYDDAIRPRLEALRTVRRGDQLRINLLMVSHSDDDHINGVLKLFNHLDTQRASKQEQDYVVDVLWHNSFDDVFTTVAQELLDPGEADSANAAAVDGIAARLDLAEPTALLLASVGQSQRLRDTAVSLGVTTNSPFDRLVMADGTPKRVGGLQYTVLGPTRTRLREFQDEWNRKLAADASKAEKAAYLDSSAFNLASIVALVEAGEPDDRKKMLLTGDARGDDVIASARELGMLGPDGTMPVDVLKCPHHGSDRNVEVDFFQTFPASTYVMSGDGEHGNPEPETFRMLLDARNDSDPFTIYLTYPPSEYKPHTVKRGEPKVPYDVAQLDGLLAPHIASGRVTVITPATGETSMKIDLLEPLTD